MSEEELEAANIDAINQNLVNTDIKFIGDRTTISQIVQLIAYIKYAIKYKASTDITVKIGKNVINTPFEFTVNGEYLQKEFIPKAEIEIN